MSYLEGVELDVGVSMRQASDEALYRIFGTAGVTGYPVANVDDGSPVLGSQVLVGRLGCDGEETLVSR